MDPDKTIPVVDNGAVEETAETVTPESSSVPGDVTSDIESWKNENKVPYSRFEEIVRTNQEFRDSFTKQLGELSEHITKFNQPTSSPDTEDLSDWDKAAQSAKSWGEFAKFMEEKLFSTFESKQKAKQEEEGKKLDSEIQSLYKSGLVTSKSEENAILDFAVKKSEELKTSIPLALAAQWYKETHKSPDNKEAAAKVQSPTKSEGNQPKIGYTEADRKKGLDEIVAEAKQHAPAGN